MKKPLPTDKKVTVYVTKYALVDGIFEVESAIDDNGYIRVRDDSKRFPYNVPANGYSLTKEEAEAKAIDMAKKAVAAAERKLNRLKKMVDKPRWKTRIGG